MKYVTSHMLKKIPAMRKMAKLEWFLNHEPLHTEESKPVDMSCVQVAMIYNGMEVFCADEDIAFEMLHTWYKKRNHAGEVYLLSNSFETTCPSVLDAMEFLINAII